MTTLEKKKNDWLKDAVPLTAVRCSSVRLRLLADALFRIIAPLIKVSSKSRQKEALKTVLINLLHAWYLDVPVRYSRDKNRYIRDRRYRQLFFNYKRLIPVIDALLRLGYIEQSSFYNDPKATGHGLQTRMWGTDRLWALCHKYLVFSSIPLVPELDEDEEIIVLRNKAKQDTGYRETRQTRQMREDLERYNGYTGKHRISVCLYGDAVVDNRFLVENLYGNIKAGKVWIEAVELNSKHPKFKFKPPIPTLTDLGKPFHTNPATGIRSLLDRIPADSPLSITQAEWRIPLLRKVLRHSWSAGNHLVQDLEKRSQKFSTLPKKRKKRVMKKQYRLRDLGVDKVVFVLGYEHSRRIFNRGSWEFGGRAYGPLHQSMLRKYMRKDILIDGQPTVEIDFSAFHILMLYHREGIEYQGDPYTACEGPELRQIYKAVGLIAINAESERKARGAIQSELRDRGLRAPRRHEPIKTLVMKFREAHPAIAHHLFSDVGVTLQNIDSEIMNAILVWLMDKGILGLSVHDSVIVAKQHAAFTKEVMTKEYWKVTGFEPRF
ncbi:MAG: hypothetical protein JEY79_19180 [Pseudodesulfovibrio sp.]|nr:hypothetical protein [Pseudodesulfovibrio sp.]